MEQLLLSMGYMKRMTIIQSKTSFCVQYTCKLYTIDIENILNLVIPALTVYNKKDVIDIICSVVC